MEGRTNRRGGGGWGRWRYASVAAAAADDGERVDHNPEVYPRRADAVIFHGSTRSALRAWNAVMCAAAVVSPIRNPLLSPPGALRRRRPRHRRAHRTFARYEIWNKPSGRASSDRGSPDGPPVGRSVPPIPDGRAGRSSTGRPIGDLTACARAGGRRAGTEPPRPR